MKNFVELTGKVVRVFENTIDKKDGNQATNHIMTIYTEIESGDQWTRKAFIPVIIWNAPDDIAKILKADAILNIKGYLKTYTKETQVPGGEVQKHTAMEVVAEDIKEEKSDRKDLADTI